MPLVMSAPRLTDFEIKVVNFLNWLPTQARGGKEEIDLYFSQLYLCEIECSVGIRTRQIEFPFRVVDDRYTVCTLL